MWYLSPGVEHDPVSKKFGVSIRCIKNANSGLEDINETEKCQLNPNPAKDIITVDFGKNQRFIMEVFNIIGACVMKREFNNGKNIIDISSLPSGTYVVRLIGDIYSVEKTLIKE
jgi:hypothetical protein